MMQFQTDWTVHIAMWHGYHFTQHVDVEPARHCSSVCLTCNKKMTLNKRGCLQCNHCINFFFRSYHSCCSPYVQRVNPNFDDARHTKYPTKSGITFFPTENARHLSNFHWVSVDFGWDFIHIKITMNFQSQPCSHVEFYKILFYKLQSLWWQYWKQLSDPIWFSCLHSFYILYKKFEPRFQNGAIQL